jgi:hypothetical protein
MEIGFYHPDRGYWQAIDVSKTPYTVIVEPERTEIGEDGEKSVIPAVTRETTQYAELLASYPEGTVEVPLKPGADCEWQDGEWVQGEPEPVRQTVLKSTVQARIIEAGKMDQAYAALTSNAVYFARWFAPDRPVVYCDDPDAMGLVQAIGLDPAVILAP